MADRTRGRRRRLGMRGRMLALAVFVALVVAGWTAGTTAAAVPYLTVEGFVFDLLFHTAVVTVPYVFGALVHRIVRRPR